ncbi:PepSY-associated TM helix domain-containing protein [Rufibacter sediminis]|uniref:PepSY domain-containing protein n=1 Tax=Rufibacter sediminis TaxID=2762756 RepID=A0ABR6VNN5_9BACT|nr:PepSY-associated TM helix domain-containing protein [Rufibacter sediminis]MBC3538805.1 PepSY domain-containing protein [Rufibacter sediminis]
MKKKFTWRKLFTDIHLWLGLASGLVLFVVCLTGTIFTFHTEIEEMLEPEKYNLQVPANATALSPDELISKLQQTLKGKVTALQIPQDPAKPYRLTLKKEEGGRGGKPGGEKAKGGDNARAMAGGPAAGKGGEGKKGGKGGPGGPGGGGRGTTYLVNQYTGEVKGTTEGPAHGFFEVVEGLHRTLMVKGEPGALNPGKIIVGGSTIIFVFLIITGLVIWFPKKLKNWKQGLKIKTDGNWKRINHDLHNSLGFYSSFLLLIMALTGLCWSFDWYREGASAVLGDQIFKQRGEKPMNSDLAGFTTQKPALVDFIKIADGVLPYEGNYRISLPADSAAAMVLTKTQSGFFTLSAADKVQLDQYTGKAIKVEKFADKKFNEKIAASVRGMHLGEIFGTFSKIIYFICCLIATSLPITGTLIWWNKLKKKSSKQAVSSRAAVSRV